MTTQMKNKEVILSLYIYHFQNNQEYYFQLTCCMLQRKLFVFREAMKYCLSFQIFWMKAELKQKSHRHICRTILLLVTSQLHSRCRFPSKHYQIYILGPWQGAKLHFHSCLPPWRQLKLILERSSKGKLAIPTETHMMNCCSGQHTKM